MAFDGITIPFPVGQQGFNGARNPSKLAPEHASYLEGVDLDGGIVVKDGGALKLNSTTLGSGSIVRAGINWSPTAGENNDVVLLASGAVLKDTGAGTFGTTLRTGLSDLAEPPPIFIAAGGEVGGQPRKLFLFSQGHQAQVVLGTAGSMAAISTPAADWASAFPAAGCLHGLRLWGYGNGNDPHRMYYSTLADHQDFTGSGSGTLAIYPGEGQTIAGAVSFRGLLVVFKYPVGIYLIDTRDPTVANWTVVPLSRAVGAVNQHCIVPIENDILYMDAGGNFHLLSATSDLGDINTSNISIKSDIGPFMRTYASLTNLRRSNGIWYANKRKAWFVLPQVGATSPTLRVMIDFNDQQYGARYLLSRRDVAISMWMRPGGDKIYKPVQGDDTGFIRIMDQDARNVDGLAYIMDMETADTDFSFAEPSLASKNKMGKFLEIECDLVRETYLTVVPYWDTIPGDPLQFHIGEGAVGLNSFQLDIHALSSTGSIIVRRRLTGEGRKLRLKITNNVLDDELRIAQVRVALAIGDEKTSPRSS